MRLPGPPPPHGSETRYKGARNGSYDPCRCAACTRAHSQAGTLRELAHLAGTPPLYPAEPLVVHILDLIDGGMSLDLIGRRARVSHSTVRYLVRGITKSCLRDRALRILAVQVGDFDENAERPAAGTMRRIQAMYALGHNPAVISEASGGLAPSSISAIANGHIEVVQPQTARGIATAYKTLITRQGASAKARSRARQMGWHGPLAWGADIDDPAAEPELEPKEKVAAGPIILQPCGTPAAYRRHLRRKESIDGACRAANSRAAADRKHAKARVAA